MSYTQLSTFNTGDLLTATDMNNIKGNLEYFAAGNYVIQEPATGSDYTTTSTSFTNVDATEWSVDITVTADASAVKIWAEFACQHSVTGNIIFFEMTRDGTALANTGSGINRFSAYVNNETEGHIVQWIDTGITPGNTHTYKLQWKVDSGTATLSASSNTHPLLVAEEVH